MIEENVICNEDIKRIFFEKYGLHIRQIIPLQGGRSFVCKIITNKGNYLLKQCLKEVDYETIATEINVCKFLKERGVPTSEFLSVHLMNERYITIQTFISGCVYENNHVPEWVLLESGKLLKEIRKILLKYPSNKIRWEPGWPFDADFEQALMELEVIKHKALNRCDGFCEQVLKDVEYKTSLIRDMKGANLVETNRLTYANTHGDYSVRQLIVNTEQSVISVVDFETFCKMPSVWEIIRSYTYASSECLNAKIDRSKFSNYLEKTGLITDLNDYDISKIYHFYALQLLLNNYGYLEYFNDNVTDKLNYIQFGIWRTKLLHELMKIIEG